MDRIRLLPEIVANQIAAGEVVNAPSNVVKEMMENSLDAGAQCVRVNYRNGGKELIQIVDDGSGMSAVDARMAFDRHATSKISSIEDVYKLHTFGFRGEALASIAAVAEVELRTRREEDEIGTITTIAGGEFRSQLPAACPKGSQFMVRNLFYNVPSRRKFIDGDNSRLGAQIKGEFQRVALCNPAVEFELRQNDGLVYQLMPTNRKGRIVDIVGKHIKQNLLDLEVDTSVVRIEGFVGRPAAAKKRNNEQYLFVNGRYFNSIPMQRTIVRAYERLIPEGCMPSYFIYLTVDPERVDVNVHPQKTTVKFADHDVILEILHAAVRETLVKTGAVPMMDFQPQGVEIPVYGAERVSYAEPRVATRSDYNPFRDEYIDPTAPMPDVPFTGFDVPYDGMMGAKSEVVSDTMNIGGSIVEYIDEEGDEETLFDVIESQMGTTTEARTFGEAIVMPGGYAVATYGGRGVVVALQRAYECVVYEDIMAALCKGSGASQRMFFAEELELSAEEYDLMESHATEFAALGFEVEYCGGGRISVVGRPAIIDMSMPIDQMIYELLHGIEDGALPLERERVRMAELMARRASRGYGHGIASVEAMALLKRLERCSNPSFTPSGAPVMAELTTEELAARLSR